MYIQFDMAKQSEVVVEIFNLNGQRVDVMKVGRMNGVSEHTLKFGTGTLPSGNYVYRITANTQRGISVLAGKMTVV